jgi:hypothetical protein
VARARRRVAAALTALAAAAIVLAPPAPALALRALHVEALSMRADRMQLQVGEVFHLAIHIRVREQVAALDELVVPDVGPMQLLGDERHATSSASGTDVVETLTLEARAPGPFTFNGAYLDAIDARTRKPSRFSANSVRVVVAGANTFVVFHYWDAVWVMVKIMLAGTGVLVAAALVITLMRTRRHPAPPAPVVRVPPPAPLRTPRDAVADALRLYRTAPAHDPLMRLRAALFAAAGVAAGATLRDALAATADRGLQAALAAAERTAFGPASARDAASAELIRATEDWLQ